MRWKEACYGGNGCDGKVLRCGAGERHQQGGLKRRPSEKYKHQEGASTQNAAIKKHPKNVSRVPDTIFQLGNARGNNFSAAPTRI
jgi:hypothetical protein